MRFDKLICAVLALLAVPVAASNAGQRAAPTEVSPYTLERVMIPMRDGARMETVILRPRDRRGKLPILIERTPYGVPSTPPQRTPRSLEHLAADGYILVYQSMRGRFGSDGSFTMSMAVQPPGSNGVDDASDAWDTIDWLVKNIPDNNGRVGMWGVSYPGYAAAIALVRPHPALKAVSPQAGWDDWWLNDDLHRYGAMRLTYAADWLYLLQKTKQNAMIAYDQRDMYDWYLALGAPANLEQRIFQGGSSVLAAMIERPDYDDFWKNQRWSARLGRTTVATLHVAGFWDQEDPRGQWSIYRAMERSDPDGLSMMVAGPWNHGSWRSPGNMVGDVPIPVESGTEFRRDIEAPFFRYWLHGQGERPRFEARVFQSGSWAWRSYANWPPAAARPTRLWLHADGALRFTEPPRGEACRSYVSDPAAPVPYRKRPIGATFGDRAWGWWEAADQRFLGERSDVLSWVSEPLTQDLTVTGLLAAQLMASSSGTDSDFVVKLIDVFPGDYAARTGSSNTALNGFQLPIAMEVRRGRWLDSFERARPLVPNRVRAWDVPLRDHDHVFRAGHRIMVQVQSSWFPVIDRNPQSFVANPYRAQPTDYVKATQRVCPGSHVTLPVVGR